MLLAAVAGAQAPGTLMLDPPLSPPTEDDVLWRLRDLLVQSTKDVPPYLVAVGAANKDVIH